MTCGEQYVTINCETPYSIEMQAQNPIDNVSYGGTIELPFFIGRATPAPIPLTLKTFAEYSPVLARHIHTPLPASQINIDITPNEGITSSAPLIAGDTYSTTLTFTKTDYHTIGKILGLKRKPAATLKCKFAKNNPTKIYEIECLPDKQFPTITIDDDGGVNINGTIGMPFEEIVVPFSIDFNYDSDTFIWGGETAQPAYPTDTEWKKYVDSNIEELKKQLKDYHIIIEEFKPIGKSSPSGFIKIYPEPEKTSQIPKIDESLTYTLEYKVDDDNKTTKSCKLNFNINNPTIECVDESTINLLVGFPFEHEIPFKTNPYIPSANIAFPASNVSLILDDWPTNEKDFITTPTNYLNTKIITGLDGMQVNQGILKIDGCIDQVPDPTNNFLFWGDKSDLILQYKTSTSGEPICTKDLGIYWKAAQVEITAKSPITVEYSAKKDFEVELSVSAAIKPLK